jgi:hypothetical protein
VPEALEASGPIPPATAAEDEAGTAAGAAGTTGPASGGAAAAAVAVEEVAAERGSAAASEQCCSGWPSSASGAGRTAPESEVEASAAVGQCSGCSAPTGQNRCRCSWCSPSVCSKMKFIRDRYCTTSGKKTLTG